MLNRRDLLKAGGAAALVAPFAGFTLSKARAQGAPLFRFGIIADPQFAPVAPNEKSNRYYANSLWKVSDAIKAFNEEDLQFVATLGDIIDRHWQSYTHILPLYDKLKHDSFFILGNHDYSVAKDYLSSVVRTTGLERAYYDFTGGGYRFIVLDGNDVSTYAPPDGDPRKAMAEERLAALKATGAENAQSWNGTLSDAQFSWLEQTIQKAEQAGERVIAMCHFPVFPTNKHNLWDCERVVDLLTSHKNVVAYMNGHNHAGNYGETGGVHFVNFQGMVDTPASTAYSVVEVHDERIEIRGFGREGNRTLALRTA